MSWNVQKTKQQFNDACNAYLKLFCEKHGFDYEEAANSWVAGEAGGVCALGDYFVSFEDMKTDIDNDAPKDEYWLYYDYSLEAHELGFICPNYANWIRGYPRLSEEQRKSIIEAKNRVYEAKNRVYEAKNRVYEAKKEFERILKEENDKIAGGF